MNKNSVSVVVSVSLLLFVGLGCLSFTANYYTEEKKLAVEALVEFHRLYDKEKYDDIVAASHPDAKAIFERDGFGEVFGKWHGMAGKVVESEVTDAVGQPAQDGYVAIKMKVSTKFERKRAMEEFIWFVKDGKALLFNYDVKPEE